MFFSGLCRTRDLKNVKKYWFSMFFIGFSMVLDGSESKMLFFHWFFSMVFVCFCGSPDPWTQPVDAPAARPRRGFRDAFLPLEEHSSETLFGKIEAKCLTNLFFRKFVDDCLS